MKQLSPFAIGEMIKNPLDDDNGSFPILRGCSAIDEAEQTASPRSVALGVAGETVDKGSDRSSATVTAIEGEDDPDLIVLGFHYGDRQQAQRFIKYRLYLGRPIGAEEIVE